MANAVSTTAATGLGAIAKGLQRAKTQMPSFGGKQYLKFAKDGEWSTGRGGDDMTGEKIVVNLASLKSGYVCWTNYAPADKKKNEKLGEEMQLSTLGTIDPSSLQDHGWEWKQQQSFEGRFLSGAKAEFVYVTSALGGLEAVDTIITACLERLGEGEETFVFPVVTLNTDWYDHPQWGKTYKPKMEITDWVNEDGDPEGSVKSKGKAEPEIEAEEPEAEEPEADAPPVRRRQR
jgi:hypothetical protein